jgi:uncharacterized protein YkwD
MKTACFTFVLCMTSLWGYSQKNTSFVWPDSLNTAKEVAYLTALEKEVILEMNKVRTNPKAYISYLQEERSFYEDALIKRPGEIAIRTNEGIAAVDECIRYLEEVPPAGLLYPSDCLTKAARMLGKHQSETGETGHNGPKGMSMGDRIRSACEKKFFPYLAENVSYGSNTSLRIVLQLMIDDGVPSRGHRENIMNPELNSCGLFFTTHPRYGHLCVIDYENFR